jgi:predicted transcriptional regulator
VGKKAPKQPSIAKTVHTEYVLTRPRKGAKLKEEVWETGDGQVVTLTTGTLDEYVERSIDRANKMDRGERIEPELRVTFQDPADLLRVLSVERIRVLRTIRRKTKPTISGLAIILKRDRKAVSRDVKLLESLGLLRTRDESNPGHGVKTVVEPLAEIYHLTATV